MLYSDLHFPLDKYKSLVLSVNNIKKDSIRVVPDIYEKDNDIVRNDLLIEFLDTVPLSDSDIVSMRPEQGNQYVIAITKHSSDGRPLTSNMIESLLLEALEQYWQYYNRVRKIIDK